MAKVHRLNHAVLHVSDAGRSAAFYAEVLGFVTVTDVGDGAAVFMRAAGTENHHDLGLFSVGAAPAGSSTAPRPGLYHLAWEVDAIEDLVEIRQRLLDAGALVGQSDHGVSKSLYAKDPDGIEFEVMWRVPREDWGVHETEATVAPLDLDAAVRSYGSR